MNVLLLLFDFVLKTAILMLSWRQPFWCCPEDSHFDVVLNTAISLRLSVFVIQTVTYQDILWQLSSNHERVYEQLTYWSSRLLHHTVLPIDTTSLEEHTIRVWRDQVLYMTLAGCKNSPWKIARTLSANIWDSRSGDKDSSLLGCYTMQTHKQATDI